MKSTIAIVTGAAAASVGDGAGAARAGRTVYALSRRPAEGEHLCWTSPMRRPSARR